MAEALRYQTVKKLDRNMHPSRSCFLTNEAFLKNPKFRTLPFCNFKKLAQKTLLSSANLQRIPMAIRSKNFRSLTFTFEKFEKNKTQNQRLQCFCCNITLEQNFKNPVPTFCGQGSRLSKYEKIEPKNASPKELFHFV